MKQLKVLPIAVGLFFAFPALADNQWLDGTDDEVVMQVLRASFEARNEATLDRLEQSEMQRACSVAERTGEAMPSEVAQQIAVAARESVKFPEDGEFLGDWRQGEKIAQSGRGLQWSDKPGSARGGNCYACHELTKAELSFGNIGTSLHHYGKLRNYSEAAMKYAWTQIYNPHAYNACSVMPRFGDEGILTEEQMKDVMALLFDPNSPVNDDSVDPNGE